MTDRMEVVFESAGKNGNVKLLVRRGERTIDTDEANLTSADERQRVANRLHDKFPVLNPAHLLEQFERYACQTVDRNAKQVARYDEGEAPAFEEPPPGPLPSVNGHQGQPIRPITYQRITAAELASASYHMEFLIEGAMTLREPLIVAGGKKTLKTGLLCDAAVSLAMGNDLLGTMKVSRAVRVLFMSGESGLATLQETFRRICWAKGHELADVQNLILSPDLPQLEDANHHVALGEMIRGDEIEVLIVDPAYMAMGGDDAGNLFKQGTVLRAFNSLCHENGVTLILCHHTRKNVVDQFKPPELEDIAWAGFQEFARQWWLIGRRERYEPGTGNHKLWLNIGGSAGHSALWALDIDEGRLSDQGGRKWGVVLTTASDAREKAAEQQQTAKADSRQKTHQAKVEAAMEAIASALRSIPGNADTKRGIRERSGQRSGAAFDEAMGTLLRTGKLKSCEIERDNGHKYEGYRYEFDDR